MSYTISEDDNILSENVIAAVPRITVQAFCETNDVLNLIQSCASDRRMHKAQVKAQMGGSPAAVEAYKHSPTPNVIILEAQGNRQTLIDNLEALSEYCDPGTKVVILGHVNDVILYRDLIKRGVSEYLIMPVGIMELVKTISELFTIPGAEPVGRTIAIVGAKGGVGSSTIAHNLAWSVSKNLSISTVVVDLDIAFGTAGLDFNQDPPQGIAEAIFAPDRIDAALVDRLLSKCSDNLSLMAAPATLDRTTDMTETAADNVVDLLKTSVPCIILDIPHIWTAWARRLLIMADEIVIVAEPELASLRNAKNMYDLLKQARPNDRQPHVILNKIGVPKRPEISTNEFSKALGRDLSATIAFDAQTFGTASNNGQMIAEVQPSGNIASVFVEIAGILTGKAEQKRSKSFVFNNPIIAKFARLKAS